MIVDPSLMMSCHLSALGNHYSNFHALFQKVCLLNFKMIFIPLCILFSPQNSLQKAVISYRCFPYSGDTDAVIPVTSTRYTIDALKLPTISPWRAWYIDGQVKYLCEIMPCYFTFIVL